MRCPVCGATCVCRNASEMCCGCHSHRARSPVQRLYREIAHAAAYSQQPEVQPRLPLEEPHEP